MKKKIISYSLWGSNPKYCINAIINCLLIPKIYPGWTARFYLDDTVPEVIVQLLRTFEYVEIVEMPRGIGSERMLWRFAPAAEYHTTFISRDCDSWISSREAACINEWLTSDKNFWCGYDHCFHTDLKISIMGGIWGSRNGIFPKMEEEINKFIQSGQSYDQLFLSTVIYPNVLHTIMIHYGDPQYNFKGERVYRGKELGGVPIPPHQENDQPINGLSFKEAHKLNAFTCCHCKKVHETYIGGMTDIIPLRAIETVKRYAKEKNISLDDYLK